MMGKRHQGAQRKGALMSTDESGRTLNDAELKANQKAAKKADKKAAKEKAKRQREMGARRRR
jgi:hypothetical protein